MPAPLTKAQQAWGCCSAPNPSSQEMKQETLLIKAILREFQVCLRYSAPISKENQNYCMQQVMKPNSSSVPLTPEPFTIRSVLRNSSS